MRRAPLNYLVTLVAGCLLWVATAIAAGQHLSDTVLLQQTTPEAFVSTYRTVVGVAALVGVLGCVYWYAYGSRDTAGVRLDEARRTWTLVLVAQLVTAALALVALVLVLSGESLTAGNYALIFALLALQTALFYWVCTFLMSPRPVEYIPWGKR
jgi:drug/metabolite transporter (DMT)-like permease